MIGLGVTGIRETDEYKDMPSKWGMLTYTEAESEAEQLAFWQYLVDTGIAWQLEGWYGRTAMDMIEEGIIDPA